MIPLLKPILLLLGCIGYVTNISAQHSHLISYEKVADYSRKDLLDKWKEQKIPRAIAPVRNGIDVYEVIYYTQWHDKSMIKASGLYYVPKNSVKKALPIVTYLHGTQIKRHREVRLGGEQAICIGFAADQYFVVRPDYVGLGKGERNHLYHHVETQSGAALDMIRAVRELNRELEVKAKNELYITGYSQGGHAAMGLHKTIQERSLQDEFNVKASAPMSGAYDLAGVQEETMFKEYSHPGYLPYLFFTFQEVYNIYDDITTIFKSPYDSILPPMYQGYHSMGQINRLIPSVPKDVVKPEVVQAYLADDNFPFKVALRENSVHDWKPEKPMLLCFCDADEQVSYLNSIIAHKTMVQNGSDLVKIHRISEHLGHNDCALFAVMYSKMFFDSIRRGHKRGTKGPLFKRALLDIGLKSIEKKAIARRTTKVN